MLQNEKRSYLYHSLNNRIYILWLVTIGLPAACSAPEGGETFELLVPATFDSLPSVPDDNKLTMPRVELGRRLFFEKALSGDGSISCGSCHKPEFAYADTVAVSKGVHGKQDFRNSPSLMNVAYRHSLFREGGVPSLELQMLGPFTNANEMDLNLRDAVDLLNKDASYRSLSEEAYGESLTPLIMARAMASFQRSLISSGSRYDSFLEGSTEALTAAEQRGMALFYDDNNACGTCHGGFLLADHSFHNVGLYENYADEGRGRLTMDPGDIGKMSTPSLRNVAITPPYMHDGSLPTLEAVLKHFNQGGKAHPNRDPRIKYLGLTAAELSDMKSFLESLTDTVYESGRPQPRYKDIKQPRQSSLQPAI